MRITNRWVIALFALLVFVKAPQHLHAQGGPPLLTDDPGTPGNRHWEINLGITLARSSQATLLETPRLDLNYGLGDHIQLKYEIPWVVLDASTERTRTGLGNSLVGVKWRFMGEKRRGVSISMYPQLEFNNPTSSANRGLVEKGAQFLLPLEMARRVGPIDVDWEFGYRFKRFQSDEWVYGLAFGHQVHKRLELLGEIHGTARRDFGEDELVRPRWAMAAQAPAGLPLYNGKIDPAAYLAKARISLPTWAYGSNSKGPSSASHFQSNGLCGGLTNAASECREL